MPPRFPPSLRQGRGLPIRANCGSRHINHLHFLAILVIVFTIIVTVAFPPIFFPCILLVAFTAAFIAPVF